MTRFGDAAVLLPVAATIFLSLLLSGASRAAAWWTASLFLCGGLIAVLKIYFWGCPPVPDLHSPSGHTSLATLVYGAIALIVAAEGGRWRPLVAATGAGGLIVCIAGSRLLLDAHSLLEIALGLTIGGGFLALFGWAYRQYRPKNAHVALLLVAVAVLVSALHGRQLHAEGVLHRITAYLRIECSCDPTLPSGASDRAELGQGFVLRNRKDASAAAAICGR